MKRFIYRILDRYFRKKAIENHRKMWRWLAEHPDKSKFDYLLEHDPHKRMSHNCYLCDYAENKALHEHGSRYHSCEACPLDWGYGLLCSDIGAPFTEYAKARNYKHRADLARQIAELPERKAR